MYLHSDISGLLFGDAHEDGESYGTRYNSMYKLATARAGTS